MRKGFNPNRHKGYRNLYCRDYNSCLDLAVARSWDSWCCAKCKYRFAECIEKGDITRSRDEIVEYRLIIQPTMQDYMLPDNDFNREYDDATIYQGM